MTVIDVAELDETATYIDDADLELLDAVQRDFPFASRPFAAVAAALGRDETSVIERLAKLEESGVISRFGAVLDHRSVGASTLAAMAVPEDRIDEVAEFVNGCEGVNHNYARENRFNLWFVVTGRDRTAVDSALDNIRARFDLPLLDLPMERAYTIDTGFPL